MRVYGAISDTALIFPIWFGYASGVEMCSAHCANRKVLNMSPLLIFFFKRRTSHIIQNFLSFAGIYLKPFLSDWFPLSN